MPARRCPRCGQNVPAWKPVHFSCFIYRLRILLGGLLLLILVIGVGIAVLMADEAKETDGKSDTLIAEGMGSPETAKILREQSEVIAIVTNTPYEPQESPSSAQVTPQTVEKQSTAQATIQKVVEDSGQVPVESLTATLENTTLAATDTSEPTQTLIPATEIPTSGSEQISTLDGMIQVFVDGGTFLMGAGPETSQADPDELPQNEIYLDKYWIDQTEVTNGQFAQFLTEIGNHRGTCLGQNCMKTKEQHELSHIFLRNGRYEVESSYEDHPVIMITWYGASAYCQWAGRRLPTSAEWEKAARGETGFMFPWGNQFKGDFVNFCDLNCGAGHKNSNFDDGYTQTAPVGSYPFGASPYGALDMAGNVSEYVADWYDENYYKTMLVNNPQGASNGTLKVRRGSAWVSAVEDMRVSNQSKSTPDSLNNNVGFRCAE